MAVKVDKTFRLNALALNILWARQYKPEWSYISSLWDHVYNRFIQNVVQVKYQCVLQYRKLRGMYIMYFTFHTHGFHNDSLTTNIKVRSVKHLDYNFISPTKSNYFKLFFIHQHQSVNNFKVLMNTDIEKFKKQNLILLIFVDKVKSKSEHMTPLTKTSVDNEPLWMVWIPCLWKVEYIHLKTLKKSFEYCQFYFGGLIPYWKKNFLD